VEKERGLPAAQHTIAIIDRLPVAIADVNRQVVFTAAHFKARHPISYADAFSVALAKIKGAAVSVVTGDPEFKAVESEVPVHWLPR
jgi:hypothetical protein